MGRISPPSAIARARTKHLLERYAEGDRTARDLLALAYEAGVKDAGHALSAPKVASDTGATGGGEVERLVSSATAEWSYHEDDFNPPRYHWHVRMNLGNLSTDWQCASEQEKPLTAEVRLNGEDEARAYLRRSLEQLFPATPTDATDGATGGGEVDYAEAARVMFEACRDRFMRPEQCYPAIDALATAGFIATPGGDLLEQAAREPTDEMLDALFPIGDGLIYREVAGAAGFSNWQPDRQEQRKRYAAMIALKPAGDGGEA